MIAWRKYHRDINLGIPHFYIKLILKLRWRYLICIFTNILNWHNISAKYFSLKEKIPELYRVSLKDASQEVVGTSNSFQQTMTYLKYWCFKDWFTANQLSFACEKFSGISQWPCCRKYFLPQTSHCHMVVTTRRAWIRLGHKR